MPDDRPMPPRALTAEELRALSDAYKAKAAQLDQLVVEIERTQSKAASLVYPGDELPSKPGEPEIVAPGFPGDRGPGEHSSETIPLPSGREYATNETMSASVIVSPPIKKRRTGAPIKGKGPVGRVAKLLGMSVIDLSKTVGANYDSMRVWNTRGKAPEDIQAKLDKLEADFLAQKKSAKHPR